MEWCGEHLDTWERGEFFQYIYILFGAVWFMIQIIHSYIMEYQFSVECSLVAQGFFIPDNLALRSFFPKGFYDSIELEL